MRFLKRQALDRRSASNTTLYSDASRSNVYVSPLGQGSLVLPNGPTTSQPGSPSAGMMRYDTTTNQVMVYQGTAWRALRFKESTAITQQSLGLGNALNTLFGPLNPAPPAQVQSGSTWGGQNLLVLVENVLQISNTNYLIAQNPVTETSVTTLANSGSTSLTLSSVTDINVGDTLTTAAPTTTVSTTVNSTTITATYVSGGVTSTTMVVNAASPSYSYIVAGQQIVTTTGFRSGQYVVSVSGTTTLTIVLSAVADTQPNGTITLDVTGASPKIGSNLIVASTSGITAGMYANAIGLDSFQTVVSASGNVVVLSSPPDSTVTGTILFTSSASSTVFAASTTVTSVNTYTGVITISQATTGAIAANRAIQSSRPAGYYIRFTSPVPVSKPVTVLIGFDQ